MTSESAPLRLGIVGCGGISERHARAAAESPTVAIVACCDILPEAAEAWAARYGCERAYVDYAAMLTQHALDAVLVATWPSQHRDHVLGCLEAGAVNILCEKALALSAAEALEIRHAADGAGALVVEAYMYRHHPAIRQLDDLLETGVIGPVDRVSAAFNLFDPEESAPDDPDRDWRQRPELAGGAPFDLACYCVDACNRFAGSAPRLAIGIAGKSSRYGTIDRLFGLIEYEDGLVGIVESSKRSHFDHELKLEGADGHLLLPVAWRIEGASHVVLRRSLAWGEFETTEFLIPAHDAFRLQLEAFAAAARGTAPPVPTLAESVITAATMDALLAGAAEGVGVPVDMPEAIRA